MPHTILWMPSTTVRRIITGCIIMVLVLGGTVNQAAANTTDTFRTSYFLKNRVVDVGWTSCTADEECTSYGVSAGEQMDLPSDTHPTKQAGICLARVIVYSSTDFLTEQGCASLEINQITGSGLNSLTAPNTTVLTEKVFCHTFNYCFIVGNGRATVAASWTGVGPQVKFHRYDTQTFGGCTYTLKYTADATRMADVQVTVDGQAFNLPSQGFIAKGNSSSSTVCH